MSRYENLSRRAFLISSGFALAAIGLNACRRNQGQPLASEHKTGASIPQEHIEATPRAQINATVQALKDNALQTSFVPEGDFTEKIYQEVQKSTFELFILSDSIPKSGTAWCFKIDGDQVYFATNRHVVSTDDGNVIDSGQVLVLRPPEKSLVGAHDIEIQTSPDRDIAIVKCRVPEEYAATIKPMSFEDNYQLEKNEQLLIVGWPDEYRAAMNLTESFQPTSAEIVRVQEDTLNKTFWALGHVDHGSSGSPAIIVKEDSPLVVGTIYSMSHDVVQHPDGFTSTRKMGGTLLNLNELLSNEDGWINFSIKTVA